MDNTYLTDGILCLNLSALHLCCQDRSLRCSCYCVMFKFLPVHLAPENFLSAVETGGSSSNSRPRGAPNEALHWNIKDLVFPPLRLGTSVVSPLSFLEASKFCIVYYPFSLSICSTMFVKIHSAAVQLKFPVMVIFICMIHVALATPLPEINVIQERDTSMGPFDGGVYDCDLTLRHHYS